MRFAIVVIMLAACQSSEVDRELGARCDTRNDCDDRCLMPSPDWPGGFCTTACETDLECPEGAVCLEEEGGVCAFMCTADNQCLFLGQGYGCKERDARGGAGKRFVCRGA